MSDDLNRALRGIAAANALLDQAVGEWMGEEHDLADMAALLNSIRCKRGTLQAIEAGVESELARACPKNKPDVPGWDVTRRGGSRTIWTDEAKQKAFGELIQTKFTDLSSGELHEGFDTQTAYEVRDLMIEAYGSADPKTTPFKDAGIDLDDYVTREKTRRTVQVAPKVAE